MTELDYETRLDLLQIELDALAKILDELELKMNRIKELGNSDDRI